MAPPTSTTTMPTSTTTMPPSSLTATARGTHVFEVRGFRGLRRRRCGVDGFVYSPAFTVAGLDWAIRYYPDGDDRSEAAGSGQHVSIFVELVTKGAAAWARVGFWLLDQATGERVPVLRTKDPILFDAGSEDSSTWGTGELARRSHLQAGSRFVLGDRLRIECTVHVCRDRLTFDDPPTDAWFFHCIVGDNNDEPDVIIDVDGETFPAHVSVLHARAPGLMKTDVHTTTTPGSSSDVDGKLRISVDDDMTAPSFRALLIFAYTDSLPIMPGLDGAGHKQMIRHLLVAAERYGMERLGEICERILCKSLDVETVADTLGIADRHGFKKLSEACVRFMDSPDICILLSSPEEENKH